eukprot:scaffold63559_cov75-Phaeocystis_antarctica.AAC.9
MAGEGLLVRDGARRGAGRCLDARREQRLWLVPHASVRRPFCSLVRGEARRCVAARLVLVNARRLRGGATCGGHAVRRVGATEGQRPVDEQRLRVLVQAEVHERVALEGRREVEGGQLLGHHHVLDRLGPPLHLELRDHSGVDDDEQRRRDEGREELHHQLRPYRVEAAQLRGRCRLRQAALALAARQAAASGTMLPQQLPQHPRQVGWSAAERTGLRAGRRALTRPGWSAPCGARAARPACRRTCHAARPPRPPRRSTWRPADSGTPWRRQGECVHSSRHPNSPG